MIISHVIGGLGNQMFQYAVGRALSLALNVPLFLDLRDFSGYALHQGFELERVFSCSVRSADHEDIDHVLGWRSSRIMHRMLLKPQLAWLRGSRFLLEPHFHFWDALRSAPSQCYIRGYWQSERYFANVANTIRQDFTFRLPGEGDNLELAQQIASVNAVSIHIRRGDYVNNPKVVATHGVLSQDYYQAAIAYVTSRVRDPYFFIFSDDMDWVKTRVQIEHPCRYISHNQGMESYNDMRLMSLCAHNIIANSTFSWWGAWLNTNPGKLVIAPARWFNRSAADTRDLYCDGWVVL